VDWYIQDIVDYPVDRIIKLLLNTIIIIIIIFNLHTTAFKAYCAIWVRLPTFTTRRLHTCHHTRAPSGGRWNRG